MEEGENLKKRKYGYFRSHSFEILHHPFLYMIKKFRWIRNFLLSGIHTINIGRYEVTSELLKMGINADVHYLKALFQNAY